MIPFNSQEQNLNQIDPRLLAVILNNTNKKTSNPGTLANTALTSPMVAGISNGMPQFGPTLPPLKLPGKTGGGLTQPVTGLLDLGGGTPNLGPTDTRNTGTQLPTFGATGGEENPYSKYLGNAVYSMNPAAAEEAKRLYEDNPQGIQPTEAAKLALMNQAQEARNTLMRQYMKDGMTLEAASAKAKQDVKWSTGLSDAEEKAIEDGSTYDRQMGEIGKELGLGDSGRQVHLKGKTAQSDIEFYTNRLKRLPVEIEALAKKINTDPNPSDQDWTELAVLESEEEWIRKYIDRITGQQPSAFGDMVTSQTERNKLIRDSINEALSSPPKSYDYSPLKKNFYDSVNPWNNAMMSTRDGGSSGYDKYVGAYPPRKPMSNNIDDILKNNIVMSIASEAEDYANEARKADPSLSLGEAVRAGQAEAALAAKDKLRQEYIKQGLTPAEASAKVDEAKINWKTGLTQEEVKAIEDNIKASEIHKYGKQNPSYKDDPAVIDTKEYNKDRIKIKSTYEYEENKKKLKNIGDNRGQVMSQRAKALRAGNTALANKLTEEIDAMDRQRLELGAAISAYDANLRLGTRSKEIIQKSLPSVTSPGTKVEMKTNVVVPKKPMTKQEFDKELKAAKAETAKLEKTASQTKVDYELAADDARRAKAAAAAKAKKELPAPTKTSKPAPAGDKTAVTITPPKDSTVTPKAVATPKAEAPKPDEIQSGDVEAQKMKVLDMINKNKSPNKAEYDAIIKEFEKYQNYSMRQLQKMMEQKNSKAKLKASEKARLAAMYEQIHKTRTDQLQQRLDKWKKNKGR